MARDECDPALHLAQLLVRMGQLDDMEESYGPARGRRRQYDALSWAYEELCDLYPDAREQSVAIADRLSRLIANTRARHQEADRG